MKNRLFGLVGALLLGVVIAGVFITIDKFDERVALSVSTEAYQDDNKFDPHLELGYVEKATRPDGSVMTFKELIDWLNKGGRYEIDWVTPNEF